MTRKDTVEFAKLFTLLSQTFDKPASDLLLQIYFDNLKDFTIDQVGAAVRLAVKTKKFWPKVAELRELVEGNPEDRAANAWAAFLEATANGGQASVQFADRATAAAMDATFGSWLEACRLLSAGGTDARGKQVGGCTDEMLASYQKSFLRHYAAALNNNREVALYRPGLSEMSIRENGGAWAGRVSFLSQPVLFVGPDKTLEVRLVFNVATGQLADESRKVLEGGYETARAHLEGQRRRLQEASQRAALPPADIELATPEEVEEIKQAMKSFTEKRVISIAE